MGTYYLKKAKDGQFYFNLAASNGETILNSEMYASKAGAENGIESVRKNSQENPLYEKKKSSSNQLYFVLKATNGQVIGVSEMYTTEEAREAGIEAVKKYAPDAKVVDET